jgi:hypothetical protein
VISMLRLVMACVVLLGLAAAPVASAQSTIAVLRDCADDGVLQGSYSSAELRKARQNIPTDTDEYTDCRDVLARALAETVASSHAGGGAAGGPAGGADTGAGYADPFTQEGRDAVAAAAAEGEPGPLEIDGKQVVPGVSGFAANAVRNEMPGSLLVVLVLLAAAALAALTPFVRRRVLARLAR